jgi:hypothetical protein
VRGGRPLARGAERHPHGVRDIDTGPHAGADELDDPPRFDLLEARPSQRLEHLGEQPRGRRILRRAIASPVGVEEAEPRRVRPFDDQRAAVDGGVVHRTEDDQVLRIMAAPVGAGRDVVDVGPGGVPAAARGAAVVVAADDLAARGGRDLVHRALAGTEALRVAPGQLDDRGLDRDLDASTIL